MNSTVNLNRNVNNIVTAMITGTGISGITTATIATAIAMPIATVVATPTATITAKTTAIAKVTTSRQCINNSSNDNGKRYMLQ